MFDISKPVEIFNKFNEKFCDKVLKIDNKKWKEKVDTI